MSTLQIPMICPSRHVDYQDKVGAWLLADASAPDMAPEYEGTSKTINRMVNVKPKRPGRLSVKAATNFEILDEENSDIIFPASAPESQVMTDGSQEASFKRVPRSSNRRSSMFSKPAQKLTLPNPRSSESGVVQESRRLSAVTATQNSFEFDVSEDTKDFTLSAIPNNQSTIKRQPRRRTVFIPSDNTTIMTIHPGHNDRRIQSKTMRASDIFIDLAKIPETNEKVTSHHRRRTLRTSLSGAPKRAPLQMSKGQQLVQNNFLSDLKGAGPGKENMPPGLVQESQHSRCAKRSSLIRSSEIVSLNPDCGPESPRTRNPVKSHNVASSSWEKNMEPKIAYASSVSGYEVVPGESKLENPHVARRLGAFTQKVGGAKPITGLRRTSALPKICESQEALPAQAISQMSSFRYDVIAEDLGSPELFEDEWLRHQEVAMSQLINITFQRPVHLENLDRPIAYNIRRSILAMYENSSNNLLSRRIQASLQFGALSIPREAMRQVSRIRFDLGQRQRFLDLWLKIYDHTALQSAAEVVLAHEIKLPRPGHLHQNSCAEANCNQATSKDIAKFLQSFLVENSDSHRQRQSFALHTHGHHAADSSSNADMAWCWRRTVLRSFMLILLLDQAKNKGIIRGCLFQHSASCKSSSSVLIALAKILLPSVGDVTRTLSHLNYHLSHVQHPLEEYTYQINNLAIDLRDGIQLSRLVEILTSQSKNHDVSSNEQDLTTLEPGEKGMACAHGARIKMSPSQDCTQKLSSLLKYPCPSRPQKLHNAEVALLTLRQTSGTGFLFDDVKAEHIVDGHREKTLDLLWTLFKIWGLNGLLNWKHIEGEILRTKKALDLRNSAESYQKHHPSRHSIEPCMSSLNKFGFSQASDHGELLLNWAHNVGRLHGVLINNLNTSFADGRAFHSILAEYEHVLPISAYSIQAKVNGSLQQHLTELGCTAEFTALFPCKRMSILQPIQRDHRANILTDKTTIPMLAILALWVMPASQAHVAATLIQRAWRNTYYRRNIKRRLICARLAHDCALVIRYRERIEWAARVIQRKWKAICDE